MERLKNSGLNGKPVIIGGSSDRGVVAACSYEARRFGLHSAMPMRLARRLCPHGIYIQGDHEDYSKYSRLVTDIIAAKAPVFEKASIDEFYLDMSGMDRFFGCSAYTSELRQTIIKESGLPISYGLSANKMVSKVATNEAKPNGQLEIPFGGEKDFLAPLSVDKMPMIGSETAKLLRSMGVERIATLSSIPREYLINMFGKSGIELWRRANGIDDTPVVPYREQKSISTESTFDTDTIDVDFLSSQLARMTEETAFELRSQGKLTGCITIKLRYSDFQTYTRQKTIAYTANDGILLQTARRLFKELYDRRLLVRLLGVRFSHLIPGTHQINLFDDTEEHIRLHLAIDQLKNRFGKDILHRAGAVRN